MLTKLQIFANLPTLEPLEVSRLSKVAVILDRMHVQA